MQKINELQLAKELIRFQTVTPIDAGVMKFLEKKLKKLGFKTKILEFKEKGFKPVKNLYARLGSKGPNFCYAGHLDVVPPGNIKDWSVNPFKPAIKNNKLIINNLSKIGSDVPACFLSKNVKVSGTGEIIQPIKLLNKKLWVLLIKPKSNYSTKNIFESFNSPFAKTAKFELTLNNLINDMNKYNNSLEKTVCRIEKYVKNVLHYLYNFNSLTLPRITGSGSTVFVLFKTKEDLKIYKKKLNFSEKDYWIQYSHLIL